MWDEVGQALSHSMTKMLSQLASLLPGIVALMTALFVSALIAWALAAILRRSLAGFDFDRQGRSMGFPGAGGVVAVLQPHAAGDSRDRLDHHPHRIPDRHLGL